MKKLPKFYQHFFSNVFNKNADTKTTVQTREKSFYSSYNLRRLQSYHKFTHFGIDRLEFLWLPLWFEKKNVASSKYINFIAILEQPEWMYVSKQKHSQESQGGHQWDIGMAFFSIVSLVFCYQNCSDLLWEKIF